MPGRGGDCENPICFRGGAEAAVPVQSMDAHAQCAKESAMTQTLNIGVIGAGRIGKVHAKTFHTLVPGARVAAISDVVPAAAKAIADEFGIERSLADHHEILADKNIDAIVICTPTSTHAQITEEAAKAGKHIFCEKPIAFDLDKIDRALKAVADNKVVFLMGFNRRYDAGHRKIRADVLAGRIGAPEMCLITSRDPSPPSVEYIRSSGGIFVDMMIHDLDLSRYFLNDEPDEIYATGSCLVDPEFAKADDYDTAMVVIRFKKGSICHIDNSRRAVYGYDQRVEVFGSKGMLSTANVLEDNVRFSGPDGFHDPRCLNFFMERYIDAFQYEGSVFARCIREGMAPPSTGFDGRQAVLMAKAAAKSSREGRAVKMSEVGG